MHLENGVEMLIAARTQGSVVRGLVVSEPPQQGTTPARFTTLRELSLCDGGNNLRPEQVRRRSLVVFV